MRAGGGTTNAELAAAFAPRPMRIVSDGKDWTNIVPEMNIPIFSVSMDSMAQRMRSRISISRTKVMTSARASAMLSMTFSLKFSGLTVRNSMNQR